MFLYQLDVQLMHMGDARHGMVWHQGLARQRQLPKSGAEHHHFLQAVLPEAGGPLNPEGSQVLKALQCCTISDILAVLEGEMLQSQGQCRYDI